MAEPMEYRARLKAKGLDGTGVTREHAKRMSRALGNHTILLIDAKHARLVTDDDGSHQVQLEAISVEPVPAEHEEAVRRVMRAIYLTRPDVAGQSVLQGTSDGETPADAISALGAIVETDDAGEVTGVWDGDPDEPITAEDDEPEAALDPLSGCAFPNCARVDGHDGDHETFGGQKIDPDAVDQ
jgi:hypothetical protein